MKFRFRTVSDSESADQTPERLIVYANASRIDAAFAFHSGGGVGIEFDSRIPHHSGDDAHYRFGVGCAQSDHKHRNHSRRGCTRVGRFESLFTVRHMRSTEIGSQWQWRVKRHASDATRIS